MELLNIVTTILNGTTCAFRHLSSQRQHGWRRADVASQLVSVLDRFATGCAAVASDDGYPERTDPARRDYRTRKHQQNAPELVLPEIAGSTEITDGARSIVNLQNDIPDALQNADDGDPGSGDDYFAERQRQYAGLGLRAVLLSRRLRADFSLSPPSGPHRRRESLLEEKVKYHDGFSVRLRQAEHRIARGAASRALKQEK
ncbi:hypothetical protein MHZ90_20760 [Pantoea sp. ACRSH]|uniref:hypothetical protein n=1 Tax=Erwiniaceae TaxID=1903409 RepID=UPI001EF3EAC4|nr:MULTISPECIES: hypothetical protein [Erwiniaceae]MCG7368530.1 hypothetical protein [Pantoea sp. ACRSH]MCG7398924.1 hypothetical protein [Pantoea sp. ACRSC]